MFDSSRLPRAVGKQGRDLPGVSLLLPLLAAKEALNLSGELVA